MEMDPDFPDKYFDGLAKDLCSREDTSIIHVLFFLWYNYLSLGKHFQHAIRFNGAMAGLIQLSADALTQIVALDIGAFWNHWMLDVYICDEHYAGLIAKDPSERLGRNGAEDILAHPWFGELDREALAMDQVESPFIPNRDINAATQRAIGSFADTGSKVHIIRWGPARYKPCRLRVFDAQ